MTTARMAEVVKSLQAVLPAGWVVAEPVMIRTPEEWNTRDNRGFEVSARIGDKAFRVWLVPRDWIGIRQARQNRARYLYSILDGPDFKLILDDRLSPLEESLSRLRLNFPSGERRAEFFISLSSSIRRS